MMPDTEAKKAELFVKVRSGAVRVLMGSTQKMGRWHQRTDAAVCTPSP